MSQRCEIGFVDDEASDRKIEHVKRHVSSCLTCFFAPPLPFFELIFCPRRYDSSMRRIMLSESDSKEKILDTLPLYVAADFPVQPMFCPMLELVHNCYVYPIKVRQEGRVWSIESLFHRPISSSSFRRKRRVVFLKSSRSEYPPTIQTGVNNSYCSRPPLF